MKRASATPHRTRRVIPARPAALLATLATSMVALLGCVDSDRPSILLVSVDTLRADHLGAYGFSADSSPEVDLFAAESIVFERALSASSRTAPSHASIMTSRWVREHSIGPVNGGTRLARDERTLAVLLRDAGWQTAAFISNLMLDHRVGLDVGFETYDDELTHSEANRDWVMERYASETTERARQWLEKDRNQPFFLWAHYNDPHGPYEPPPPHDRIDLLPLNPNESVEELVEESLPTLEQQLGFNGIPAYQKIEGLSKPNDYHRRYAGEIHAFDESFGKLLASAEQAAGSDPLIVLLTADHGESLGEGSIYFSHGHGTTPDLAHVPFILSAPELPPGRLNELVHHVDILPTLLDLANLPIPEEAHGIALGAHLRAQKKIPSRTLFVDVGAEASAYGGNRFLRAHLGKSIGNVSKGAWDGFRWLNDGSISPDDSSSELRPALEAYLRLKARLLRANAIDPEKKALLRALGYLPPE